MTDNSRESRSSGIAQAASQTLPFSFPVDVDRVAEEGLDLFLSANPEERQALAAFNKIPAVANFEAEVHIARRGLEDFNVSGEMRATVTQICVVSLEPFETEIIEVIDVDFARLEEPAGEKRKADNSAGSGAADDEDEAEMPDPIVDGKIDVGALAAEFLALGLDPYPRKPGVEFHAEGDAEAGDKPESPFAILKGINTLKK